LSQPISRTDAVERIAANRFFDIHAGEIAEQHRGRPQLRLAERHDGKLEWKSAGLVHAAFHEFRELAEMSVARREFGPRVADADDRAAIEEIVRIALILDPAAMQETVFSGPSEPLLAAARFLFPRPFIISVQGANIREQ
jgi:hypothetical protein